MQELEDSDSAFKELPYYRAIFKSFLRRQIQHLLEELSCETGEESIILTADIMNGTLSHLGSCTGKGFLEGREDIKTQFLSYCLKTYHGQKTHESLSPYQRTHSSPRTSGPSAAKRPRHQQVKPASSIFHKQNRAPIQQAPSTSIEVEPSLTGVTSLEQRVDLAGSVKMEKNETEQNTGSPELSLPFLLASTGKVSTTASAASALPALTPPSSASLVNYPHQSYDTPRSSHTQSSADICEDEADGTDSNLEHKSSEIDCGVKEIKREPEDSDDLELTGVDVAGDSSMSLDTWGLSQYGLGTSGTDASPASHTMRRPAKSRIVLSLFEKIQILQDHESSGSMSQRKLAEKYNVSKTSIGEIIRKKDYYLKHSMTANLTRKRITYASKYADINEIVFQWYKAVRDRGETVSGPIVQEKALQFAHEMSIPGFKASNGWLQSWRSRYGIDSFKSGTDSGNSYVMDGSDGVGTYSDWMNTSWKCETGEANYTADSADAGTTDMDESVFSGYICEAHTAIKCDNENSQDEDRRVDVLDNKMNTDQAEDTSCVVEGITVKLEPDTDDTSIY